ncbi:MAG: hypothetical protein LAT53_11990 [Idiomarina sp.]|nr:hypothetical protein [Idiomarina sp.]
MSASATTLISPEEINSLDHFEFNQYVSRSKIKTKYIAREKSFQFYLLDDIWQLKTYGIIDLTWISASNASPSLKLSLRLALADQATNLSFRTIEMRTGAIKALIGHMNSLNEFQSKIHTTTIQTQKNIQQFFRKLRNTPSPHLVLPKLLLHEIAAYADQIVLETETEAKNISSPTKGAYSEAESDDINSKLRMKCTELISKLNVNISARLITQLGTIIAVMLLKTIFRRQVQLVQIKWNDILPIGLTFTSHRDADIPKIQVEFSDVDELHLRTFKGKDGRFRHQAEIRSHRLNTKLTRLLLTYRGFYQRRLMHSLENQGIEMSADDIAEIMNRLPMFPREKLFSTRFSSKQEVFKSCGYQSESFHKNGDTLQAGITNLSNVLELHSDRVESLVLSNNRFRHTVLTNGARDGLNIIQLSKITGVTPQAVKPYLDLSIEARIQIDEALATNHVINRFSQISVKQLQTEEGFKVVDEFDNEQGVIEDGKSCSTCASKLGIPLGCYGCHNFKPLIDADHGANLEKIERKLAKNKDKSSKAVIRKLEKSRLYIKATMTICDQILLAKKGIKDDRD